MCGTAADLDGILEVCKKHNLVLLEDCGQAIFNSKDDPDYKAILKTFEPLHEMLKNKPRIDMLVAAQVQQRVKRQPTDKINTE